MVRTRSGRATTEAENKEAAKQKKAPVFVYQPMKSKKAPKNVPLYSQFLADLRIWKPTEKTMFYWGSFWALIILAIAGYSVYDIVEFQYPYFHFFQLVLAIHCFDILTNFCNVLVGRAHLNEAIFFTESAVNVAEVYLFLFMTGQASSLFVAGSLLFTFNALVLNLRLKDDQKAWVRFLVYGVLIGCFALNAEYVMADIRIQSYFALVFVSMIFDVFDFPDQYFPSVQMSEGFTIFSRSLGMYMLITALLLFITKSEFTNFENMVKSWIGI